LARKQALWQEFATKSAGNLLTRNDLDRNPGARLRRHPSRLPSARPSA